MAFIFVLRWIIWIEHDVVKIELKMKTNPDVIKNIQIWRSQIWMPLTEFGSEKNEAAKRHIQMPSNASGYKWSTPRHNILQHIWISTKPNLNIARHIHNSRVRMPHKAISRQHAKFCRKYWQKKYAENVQKLSGDSNSKYPLLEEYKNTRAYIQEEARRGIPHPPFPPK